MAERRAASRALERSVTRPWPRSWRPLESFSRSLRCRRRPAPHAVVSEQLAASGGPVVKACAGGDAPGPPLAGLHRRRRRTDLQRRARAGARAPAAARLGVWRRSGAWAQCGSVGRSSAVLRNSRARSPALASRPHAARCSPPTSRRRAPRSSSARGARWILSAVLPLDHTASMPTPHPPLTCCGCRPTPRGCRRGRSAP